MSTQKRENPPFIIREELNWSPSSVKKLSRMKFKGWFVEEKSEHEKITRTQKPSGLMKQIPCRTQRYQRSSLPLMTKILAWHPPLPPPVLKLPWFYPSLSKSWLLWYKSRQHTATSWAFELYHLRLYSLKYTVNIYMTHSQMLGKFEYTLPAKFWRLVGCTEMLSW